MTSVVIGGGVVGLFVAHYLERMGAEPIVVDAAAVGGGCSRGNGGWVCPSLSTPLPAPGLSLKSLGELCRPESPFYIRLSAIPHMASWLWAFHKHCNTQSYEAGKRSLSVLNAKTRDLYRDLSADGIPCEYTEMGMLFVYARKGTLDRKLRALAARASDGDDSVEVLDPDEVRRREPGITGPTVGGYLLKGEAHLRPEALCANLAANLRQRGVQIVENARVTGLLRSKSGRLRAALTDREGEIEGDAFVIATGAEASLLADELGLQLPVQAGKGYSITVDEPRVKLQRPLYLADASVGLTPFDGAVRTLGTMELSGVNRRMDHRRISILERAVRRYVPNALEGRQRTDWVGMRPITPDGLPVVGRVGDSNCFVATGHQMLGVTLAPSTGHALAELMVHGRSSIDLTPFDPARF